jgi:DNA-binding MarR family transcriptional regulator
VRVSDIGERVGVTTQAAGQFVSALVESGHLVQVPDPSDGRARLVSRTAAGTRAVRLVRRRIAALEATWADQVGPQRYATFRSVLRDLNDRDREGRPKPV